MSKEGWMKKVAEESVFRHIIPEFARTIAALDIQPEQVAGRVLLVGPSAAIPERALICKPPDMNTLRDEIQLVLAIDPELMPSPVFFRSPVRRLCDESDVRVNDYKGVLTDRSTIADIAGNFTGPFADCALMFRIHDMDEQLPFVLPLLEKILNPGGYFIGSGSFPNDLNLVAKMFTDPFKVIRLQMLSNWSTGYPFVPCHIGFIVQVQ